MLAERLFQFLKDLEILRQLEWEVERASSDSDALRVAFNTFLGKFWFRVDIEPEKDKMFCYFFSSMSEPIKVRTEREVAAWLLSDLCTFYLLLVLQKFLKNVLGHMPFGLSANPINKDNKLYVVADEIAIVTSRILRRPNDESGVVVVQVPFSLDPQGFYAAVTIKQGSETVLELRDTYTAIVRSLECAIALNLL
jgi:hypothetical protein